MNIKTILLIIGLITGSSSYADADILAKPVGCCIIYLGTQYLLKAYHTDTTPTDPQTIQYIYTTHKTYTALQWLKYYVVPEPYSRAHEDQAIWTGMGVVLIVAGLQLLR